MLVVQVQVVIDKVGGRSAEAQTMTRMTVATREMA